MYIHICTYVCIDRYLIIVNDSIMVILITLIIQVFSEPGKGLFLRIVIPVGIINPLYTRIIIPLKK
jgi:hypothetical protein